MAKYINKKTRIITGTNITKNFEFHQEDTRLNTNCNYNAYNKNTQKVLCECNIKIKFPIISEIVINQNKLLNNFKDIESTLNINIIKCYSTLFKKEGIINNIGNYVISIIIIFTIIYYVYYLK